MDNFWSSGDTWLKIALFVIPLGIGLGGWLLKLQSRVVRAEFLLEQRGIIITQLQEDVKALDKYSSAIDNRLVRIEEKLNYIVDSIGRIEKHE
jgi:hypothetical protein